jgi:catechol 2,3-dioxygenase-like lactoylglutathione lyase family enzyme
LEAARASDPLVERVVARDHLLDRRRVVRRRNADDIEGDGDRMTVQITFAANGGSGAPTPDLSIEVDDLDAALSRVEAAGIPIEYGPVNEPWGVRRFFVRDPFGKLVNILAHRWPRGSRLKP